jgi:hypothetical protein
VPGGVQFGGHVGGFGRADPLEDRQRLPQLVFGLGGVAKSGDNDDMGEITNTRGQALRVPAQAGV